MPHIPAKRRTFLIMFARLLVDKTEVEVLDGSVIVDNERIGELLVLT